MKWIKIGAALIIVAVVAFALARDALVQRTVQRALSEAVDAEVELGEVRTHLFRNTVVLRDIRVLNPEGFPEGAALDINEVMIRYNLPSLLTRNVRLPEVLLDVKEVVMITNEQGTINLQQVAPQPSPDAPRPQVASPPAPPAGTDEPAVIEPDRAPVAQPEPQRDPKPARELIIEKLTLRLGEIHMHDYSRGGDPHERTYRLNFERSFEDVTDTDSVVQALMVDLAFAMGPQLMRDLMQDTNVSPDALRETIATHDGDLEDLGRKLDTQTKDLQRELRRQLRSLRGED